MILVVGATGLLGGAITRKLLAAGHRVRALGRNEEKLTELARVGAEVARVDLRDERAVRTACEGVQEVVATANNILGSGATSPLRVDLHAYENLCHVAKENGVRRLLYVSFLGATADSIVDFFRVKFAIEGIVVRSGLPYVILRPSAFMDIWAEVLFGKEGRPRAATLFGGGKTVRNFIAVEDVADFVVAIVGRADVVNEIIEIGGPSNASFADFTALVERALEVRLKRRSIPTPVLRFGRYVVRPFNEVASRMMTMGYWTTLEDRPFDAWEESARRFGVRPRSLDIFVRERFSTSR